MEVILSVYRFDGQQILTNLLQMNFIPRCLMRGHGLYTISVAEYSFRFVGKCINYLPPPVFIIFMYLFHHYFIDSMLYLPRSLSVLAKTYNIKERKGVFSYKYNRPENWGSFSPLPPLHFFLNENDDSKKREETINWYNEHAKQHPLFSHDDSLWFYGTNDTVILRSVVTSFVEQSFEYQRMLMECFPEKNPDKKLIHPFW